MKTGEEHLRRQILELQEENRILRQQLQEIVKDRDQLRNQWQSTVQAAARRTGASRVGTDSKMSSKLRNALRE